MNQVNFKDRTAIVGIGWSPDRYTKYSGVSVLTLALRASKNAIEDSGLLVEDIDGIVTYSLNDSVNSNVVATQLGLPTLQYAVDYTAGGNVACSVVSNAAMAVATGMAKNVLVYRSMNGSSGIRYSMGDRNVIRAGTSSGSDAEPQFLSPYGAFVAPHFFALLTRRHMIQYGLTSRQLGAVAVTCRKNALMNDRAQMQKPMTMEDYDNNTVIYDPLRVYDCCLTSDGACALIVTSAERAKGLRRRPVYIMAAAEGGGPGCRGIMWSPNRPDYAESWAKYIAPTLWERAGIVPKDIDFAELYDCFTVSVTCQLEDFGFCKKGEGGPFAEEGRMELTGELPVNTQGGLLSEAYIHGLNNVVEAVSQLRGDAGVRQVKNAEIGLVSAGGAASMGSALILKR